MSSIYHNLRTSAHYSSSTGLDKERFDELYIVFNKYYIAKQSNALSGKEAALTDSREALFFILYYLKVYPTFEVLGLTFNISAKTAFQYVNYIKPFLKKALEDKKSLVKRVFNDQQEFDNTFIDVEDIIIDGTECAIQRADNEEVQREDFSGKKKFHTRMALIISDKKGRIIYIGKVWPGSNVDITLFKKELSGFDYSNLNVWVDLGFPGVKSLIKAGHIFIPNKKPRGGKLTDQEKEENKLMAKIRVKVEHAIAGLKRYFVLRNENRMRNREYIDDAFELCGSLWNLKRGFIVECA